MSEINLNDSIYQSQNIGNFIDNWQKNKARSADSALGNKINKDTVQISKDCTDGNDDGKITTKKKVKNFAKGMAAPITNMFKSPKNFIKGIGAIATCAGLIYITGGAAAPVLVAAGVLGGGIQIGVNAHKAKNAKTDGQAKQAWQGMGTGTTTVAASVAGAKSALKASGTEAAAVSKMGPIKATINCFKKTGNYGKTIFSSIKSAFSSGKAAAASTAEVTAAEEALTAKTTNPAVEAEAKPASKTEAVTTEPVVEPEPATVSETPVETAPSSVVESSPEAEVIEEAVTSDETPKTVSPKTKVPESGEIPESAKKVIEDIDSLTQDLLNGNARRMSEIDRIMQEHQAAESAKTAKKGKGIFKLFHKKK